MTGAVFGDAELTDDAFLDGRLRLWQPAAGYRAAADPVLLAAAAPALAGARVLDLGCGVLTAGLCLAARVPGIALAGLERQPAYADLARRNAARNGVTAEVVTGDVAALPAALRRPFDLVLLNPPYYTPGDGTPARDAGRESALREDTPLAVWLDAAARRVVDGGWLCLIQDAARLPDVLAALPGTMGSVAVLPTQPRHDRPARRIILRARKGGRAPFRLLAPLVLHEGASHRHDRDDYTPHARAILRDGAAISAFG
ncbi:MAG: tRNA1(Val) (adenine(37)-N6)-methyltransferase [Gemmobacter sp.]